MATMLTLTANVTTRANLISYWNTNAAAINDGTMLFGGVTVGRGAGALAGNTACGQDALAANTTGSYNTACGTNALAANTTGSYNTACGSYALAANTTGANNTACGMNALAANTTGVNNTACGTNALAANTTGSYNTAYGSYALAANTIGLNNTAYGSYALAANTIGAYNTACGMNALAANTTGGNNTACGTNALAVNTIGSYNTACGTNALAANTTDGNTACGAYALAANTTGSYNTACGFDAGNTLTTGTNVTCIGHNAQPSAANATNEITLGNVSVATLRCAVTSITAISDRRDKSDINDLAVGLDFIQSLKPRKFKWAKRAILEDLSFGKQEPDGTGDIGFIAQELDEAQKLHEVDLGLVLKANNDRWEATPGRLLPVLVCAVQELADRVAQLEEVK